MSIVVVVVVDIRKWRRILGVGIILIVVVLLAWFALWVPSG
jgi:hypothetical protein